MWADAREGDAAAYGELFECHARAVYNYCFRRTASWSEAEDLTSLVFLEVWRRRRRVVIVDDSLLPWLLGVATNVLRNRRRSLRRHDAALSRLALEHEPDFADEAASRVDDERAMRVVLRAVATLPRREQDVLTLCGWSGLSYEQASAVLGVPVGTVRSRLSRARSRLRELRLPSGHEPGDTNPVLAEERGRA